MGAASVELLFNYTVFPYVERLLNTPTLMIVAEGDDLLGNKNRNAYAIAMRWTALDADVDPVGVGLAMNRATDVASFIEAVRGWVAPMQNMVVADREGAIAMVSPGRVPLRKPENDLKGLVPAPGWDARYDWAGFLHARVDRLAPQPPFDGLTRAGYRLVFNETRSDFQKAYETERKRAEFMYSLGFSIGEGGAVVEVMWDSPAFNAGLTTGAKLIAVVQPQIGHEDIAPVAAGQRLRIVDVFRKDPEQPAAQRKRVGVPLGDVVRSIDRLRRKHAHAIAVRAGLAVEVPPARER